MTGGVWHSSDMTAIPLQGLSGVAVISLDRRPCMACGHKDARSSLKQTGPLAGHGHLKSTSMIIVDGLLVFRNTNLRYKHVCR